MASEPERKELGGPRHLAWEERTIEELMRLELIEPGDERGTRNPLGPLRRIRRHGRDGTLPWKRKARGPEHAQRRRQDRPHGEEDAPPAPLRGAGEQEQCRQEDEEGLGCEH